jgi:hypothetical protein
VRRVLAARPKRAWLERLALDRFFSGPRAAATGLEELPYQLYAAAVSEKAAAPEHDRDS